MKAILPILICSTITGLLGYYYGQISKPTVTGQAATQPAPTAATTAANVSETFAGDSKTQGSQATTAYNPNPTSTTQPVATQPSVASTPAPSASTTTPATGGAPNDFAARAAKPTQTLTDTQGRTIQASILNVTATEVKIRRADGLETSIPLSMLSSQDVAFCNYLREQNKTQNEVKPTTDPDAFDWDSYFNS